MNDISKLDARSRWLLSQEKAEGPIELLIRLEFAPSAEERLALNQVTREIRSAVGPIVTATAEVNSLPALSELPFVRSIQFSKELYNEMPQ